MSKRTYKMAIAAAAAAGLLIAAPAFADPVTGPGPGMSPGMMGGGEQECDMGPQMAGGYGHGQGMGPGMMGGPGYGQGVGSGMMGGYGHGNAMAPGMMGGAGYGSGMGSGMMGGYGQGSGMGPGMLGYGGARGLNLSDEQRAKARKIHDAARKKMWPTMGGMLDASSKLRELLSDSTRDRAVISAAYKQVAELRQQMFEVGLDTQEEFERMLTADQRKQLRR